MFLSNGHPTEAVDVMQYCWSGVKKPRAPSIMEITLNGNNWTKIVLNVFQQRKSYLLEYIYDKYDNDSLIFDFQIYPETFSIKGGGDFQESPEKFLLK